MPWIQTDPVTERQKAEVRAAGVEGPGDDAAGVPACRQFGISRKTGYKILARHAELGMAGLTDASRAPKTHPNQSPLARPAPSSLSATLSRLSACFQSRTVLLHYSPVPSFFRPAHEIT